METDFELLGSALDALDRLYDGEDELDAVGAVLVRCGATLGDRELGDQMRDVGQELLRISQLPHPDSEKRRMAELVSQGDLRVSIAGS